MNIDASFESLIFETGLPSSTKNAKNGGCKGSKEVHWWLQKQAVDFSQNSDRFMAESWASCAVQAKRRSPVHMPRNIGRRGEAVPRGGHEGRTILVMSIL